MENVKRLLLVLVAVLVASVFISGCGYQVYRQTALPFTEVNIGFLKNETLEPKLQDRLSRALAEIGAVSQRLSQLIEGITTTTEQQAKAANDVAVSMQDILNITQQTTEGTKRTAVSIGELAELAKELKGSVSGFKIA